MNPLTNPIFLIAFQEKDSENKAKWIQDHFKDESFREKYFRQVDGKSREDAVRLRMEELKLRSEGKERISIDSNAEKLIVEEQSSLENQKLDQKDSESDTEKSEKVQAC